MLAGLYVWLTRIPKYKILSYLFVHIVGLNQQMDKADSLKCNKIYCSVLTVHKLIENLRLKIIRDKAGSFLWWGAWVNMLADDEKLVGQRQKISKLHWLEHPKTVTKKQNLDLKISYSKPHIWGLSFNFRFSSRRS